MIIHDAERPYLDQVSLNNTNPTVPLRTNIVGLHLAQIIQAL